MERKKLTELAGVDKEQARHIDAEEIRGFWRGMLCSEYPAAEDAPGGVEKIESMIKLSAEILRSGYDVIKEGNGFFLFFYNGMNEERPTDAEIAEAIKEREENPAAAEAEESTKGYCMYLLQTTVLENELLPFIRAALRRVAADPANKNINMLEYLFSGRTLQSNFVKVLESAAQALPTTEQADAYTVKPVEKIVYPLDIINASAWDSLFYPAAMDGQMRFNPELNPLVNYSVNFSALEQNAKLSRQLTQFDKRLYVACGALFNSKNPIFSYRQLFRTMGYTTEPNAAQLEKMNNSLRKMRFIEMIIDNEAEAEAYENDEYKYPYNGALLPWESVEKRTRINGQLVDGAIHLLRKPPLIEFAEKRKQITTIARKLLESPINKTEENLSIDDYLIEQISRIKHKNRSPRVLYDTICKECKITTKKQRQRLPEKVARYLAHYKSCSWIKEFTEQKDGVTIIL